MAGCGTEAWALTDEEHFRLYPFHFIRPGARALGMGGAYVAIADDATAAEHNPAGLRAVTHPQLYLEFGHLTSDAASFQSSQGGLQVDLVTGERDLPFLALTSEAAPEDADVPVLAGFSWPFALGDDRRLVLAGSRQVVYSLDVDLPSGGGPTQARFSFDSFPNTVNGGQVEAYAVGTPVEGDLSTEIVYWNAVASADLHPDFSAGVTLTYAALDLDYESQTVVVDPQQILVNSSHPRLPAQPDTDVYRAEADGSDADLTWSVGVHWHPGTAFAKGISPWRFGASFRKGISLGVEQSTLLNGLPDRSFENKIVVPDEYSVGVSYRFGGRWLVGAEVDRVEFSDYLDEYQAGVNYLTSPHLASGAFATNPSQPITYKVNDGNIYRLGVEYVYPVGGGPERGVAFRAGWYHSPDTQIRMTRFNSTDPNVNDTYEEAFPEGESESHFTLGVGFDWGGPSLQMGFETSDFGERLLATYVHTWGRK